MNHVVVNGCANIGFLLCVGVLALALAVGRRWWMQAFFVIQIYDRLILVCCVQRPSLYLFMFLII